MSNFIDSSLKTIDKGQNLIDGTGEILNSSKNVIGYVQEAIDEGKNLRDSLRSEDDNIQKAQQVLETGANIANKGVELLNTGRSIIARINDLKETFVPSTGDNSEVIESTDVLSSSHSGAMATSQDALKVSLAKKAIGSVATVASAGELSATAGAIAVPAAATAALAFIAKEAKDAVKVVQVEKTKQTQILAARDKKLAQIHAMSSMLNTYLEKTFDERAKIFAEEFKAVDQALENGDVQMLSLALTAINKLAESSPFKALSDIVEVKKALAAKDTEWDI